MHQSQQWLRKIMTPPGKTITQGGNSDPTIYGSETNPETVLSVSLLTPLVIHTEMLI